MQVFPSGKDGVLKIAMGSDHRGYPLKERLKKLLSGDGHEIVDVGTDSVESADYPDYAFPVAEKTASGEVERGIVICGSGIGVSIAANKVEGARASYCRTVEEARMTRRHNDSNVLALSESSMEDEHIDELVRVWLATGFDGGRHQRRVDKIIDYEKKRQ
jgi:ribose 5-phosphate isomerase B